MTLAPSHQPGGRLPGLSYKACLLMLLCYVSEHRGSKCARAQWLGWQDDMKALQEIGNKVYV